MQATKVTIRPALPDDAPFIARILRSLGWFDCARKETQEQTQARVRRHIGLCNADNSHSVYVAENAAGAVVGYVSVHWLPYLFLPGPEGYLSELFVDEQYRGRGIGKVLLKSVIQEAKRRSCARLILITSRERESYRREFYAKAGWVERERMANFIINL